MASPPSPQSSAAAVDGRLRDLATSRFTSAVRISVCAPSDFNSNLPYRPCVRRALLQMGNYSSDIRNILRGGPKECLWLQVLVRGNGPQQHVGFTAAGVRRSQQRVTDFVLLDFLLQIRETVQSGLYDARLV